MKRFLLGFGLSSWLSLGALTIWAQPEMVILPGAEGTSPGAQRVIWSTDPGIRYELQESTDLNDPDGWATVEGYPSEAEALAQQAMVEQQAAGAKFYRVVVLDEQPPTIVQHTPGDGAFGVRRFSAIRLTLEDSSPIDPDSIRLTVGGHGVFAAASPQLTFEDNTLVFDLGGDTALGGWGETIAVELTAADVLGNAAAQTWMFRLEQEPIYVEELFIFGSPDAQRVGQEIGAIPTRIVAQRWAGQSGPIRMNGDADPWRLVQVGSDRLLIEYDGQSPGPHFAAEQYACNIVPATLAEIFYRRITEVIDDPASSILTLMTEDVSLADIARQETFRLDEDALAFEVDELGVITRAASIRAFEDRFALDPIGIDWSGMAVFGTYTAANGSLDYAFGRPLSAMPPGGSSWDSRLFLDQGYLRVTPILRSCATIT